MKCLLLLNVGERLFDELVKEWLKSRYTIVSETFREVNGRRTRVRREVFCSGHFSAVLDGVFFIDSNGKAEKWTLTLYSKFGVVKARPQTLITKQSMKKESYSVFCSTGYLL